jgi:ABC-type dipeptide/oligopeptide/nickel transport system ATPase component
VTRADPAGMAQGVILLMDEWLGVVDASFQKKAYDRMASFVGGSSVLVLAPHSAHLLDSWCNKAVRVEGGRIVERGAVRDLVPKPGAKRTAYFDAYGDCPGHSFAKATPFQPQPALCAASINGPLISLVSNEYS